MLDCTGRFFYVPPFYKEIKYFCLDLTYKYKILYKNLKYRLTNNISYPTIEINRRGYPFILYFNEERGFS